MHRPKQLFLIMAVLVGLAGSPLSAQGDKSSSKSASVDQIKGIGKFTLGQKFTDFPAGLLQVIDPKASGVLLRVSPYGDNYLVTDVKGMTWGAMPIVGVVLTFHSGLLIDIQVALKAKRLDFYVADRAFKAKYGPNDPKTYPIETWKGKLVQMTLIFPETTFADAKALDSMSKGKIDLFDQARWNKIQAENDAAIKDVVDKRYQAAVKDVQADL